LIATPADIPRCGSADFPAKLFLLCGLLFVWSAFCVVFEIFTQEDKMSQRYGLIAGRIIFLVKSL